MEKVMKILNLGIRIMLFIVLLFSSILSLVTAYIVLAPDELPKPFYLVYAATGTTPVNLPTGYYQTEPTTSAEGATTGSHATEEETSHETEAEPGAGFIVNMGTKIINLADPSGRKYIRVTMALEFAPAPEAEEASGGHGGEETSAADVYEAEINSRMPVMDDVVITLLSTKTYEELYTAEGKEALRKEILEAVNQRLPDIHLLNVYFTEFVVQ